MKERPKSSVVWEGFTFVPLTSRVRAAAQVVFEDRVYVLCPGASIRIAVVDDKLFRHGEPTYPERCASALYNFNLLTGGAYMELKARLKTAETANIRKRQVRDLRDALDELGLYPSDAQEKAIKEFFPEYKFK